MVNFWFLDLYVRNSDVVTLAHRTRKWQTQCQQLFLDPSENWGRRTTTTIEAQVPRVHAPRLEDHHKKPGTATREKLEQQWRPSTAKNKKIKKPWNRNEDCLWWAHQYSRHSWRKNHWAWGYIIRNCKLKSKGNNGKSRVKYLNTVRQLQKF